MDSYRVEVRAGLEIALADQDAEIEPVPTSGGGFIPEPELDRLSNILRAFNDQFGNIDWKDADKIRQVIAEEIPAKVAADKAYQNAMKHSDKQNARLEHDKALQRVLIELLADHTELYKQFSDNPAFKKWLADTVFTVTYSSPPVRETTHAQFRLRIVEPRAEDRYVTCVPLVPLKVAAGAFSDPQHLEDENWEWVEIETRHRLRPGMFVAQVIGKSMEPAIPDGSYCLFASPVEGSRQGKTVLVQLRDAVDPETGERYTVKRYESEKIAADDSWRHSRITLKPVNPEFEAIELSGAEEGQVQVIAECIEVLGSPS
jgi:SOS-response transcriptional repressor LexA